MCHYLFMCVGRHVKKRGEYIAEEEKKNMYNMRPPKQNSQLYSQVVWNKKKKNTG